MFFIPAIVAMSSVGVGLWVIDIFIIKDYKVKLILNIMIIIVAAVWILQSYGILVGHINTIPK